MTKTLTSKSVVKVLLGGKVVGYLSQNAINSGVDIRLDLLGYELVAI